MAELLGRPLLWLEGSCSSGLFLTFLRASSVLLIASGDSFPEEPLQVAALPIGPFPFPETVTPLLVNSLVDGMTPAIWWENVREGIVNYPTYTILNRAPCEIIALQLIDHTFHHICPPGYVGSCHLPY